MSLTTAEFTVLWLEEDCLVLVCPDSACGWFEQDTAYSVEQLVHLAKEHIKQHEVSA